MLKRTERSVSVRLVVLGNILSVKVVSELNALKHIVDSCPATRLGGGLQCLHASDRLVASEHIHVNDSN